MRWAELVRSLNVALHAAQRLGDWPAVAWAKHELRLTFTRLVWDGSPPPSLEERMGLGRHVGSGRARRGRIGGSLRCRLRRARTAQACALGNR
jgi:hypothetical protein